MNPMKHSRISILFAALAAVLTVQSSALTLETVQPLSEDSAVPKEAILAATETAQKPGLNYITGTTEAEGFESCTKTVNNPSAVAPWKDMFGYSLANGAIKLSYISSFATAKANTISAYPDGVAGNDSEWAWYDVVSQSAASQGNHRFVVKGNFENGRKYWFAFDYYTNMFDTLGADTGFNYYVTQTGKSAATWTSVKSAVSAKKWFSCSQKEYLYSGTDGGTVTLQTQTYHPGKTAAFWYDNIMVMPYYKINYVTSAGTTTEQVLFADADKTQILTEYTPRSDNYPFPINGMACIGWSTQENAAEAMTVIPLENSDITLYPVYETTDKQFVAPKKVVSASSEDTVWVYLPNYADDMDYICDAGVTDVVVTQDDDGAFHFVPNGMPGEVTFTAEKDGETVETLTVQLLGGNKWRPGLDLATGTEKTFDFDGYTNTEIGYAYDITNFTVNSDEENTFVTADRTYRYLRPKTTFELETERPLLFDYQHKGEMSIHFIVMNGETVSYNMGNTTSEKWARVNFMHKASGKAASLSSITSLGIGGQSSSPFYSFDSIRIVPSYKITYVSTDGEKSAEYVLCDKNMNILHEYTLDLTKLGTPCYSLTKDGKLLSADTPIRLNNEDVTVYAREAEVALEMDDTLSVRDAAPAGIRFKTLITKNSENLSEIGFMATRAVYYNQYFADDKGGFTLANKETQNGKRCVVVNRSGDEIASFITPDPGKSPYFSAVVTGVPMESTHLQEELYLRSYAKCGGVTYYSGIKHMSIYSAAKQLVETEGYKDNAYLKGIIEKCEPANG